jgi:hypothetical protein
MLLKFFYYKVPHFTHFPGYESEVYLKIKKGKRELKYQKCNEKGENCNKFYPLTTLMIH